MITYILLWFPMLFIAIVNAALREFVFAKFVTVHSVKKISTVILIILFAIYIGFVLKRYPPATTYQSVLIGVLWMIMTLLFEFGFGRYRGDSFQTMLQEYEFLNGNIWILVPFFLCVAPLIYYRIRSKKGSLSKGTSMVILAGPL